MNILTVVLITALSSTFVQAASGLTSSLEQTYTADTTSTVGKTAAAETAAETTTKGPLAPIGVFFASRIGLNGTNMNNYTIILKLVKFQSADGEVIDLKPKNNSSTSTSTDTGLTLGLGSAADAMTTEKSSSDNLDYADVLSTGTTDIITEDKPIESNSNFMKYAWKGPEDLNVIEAAVRGTEDPNDLLWYDVAAIPSGTYATLLGTGANKSSEFKERDMVINKAIYSKRTQELMLQVKLLTDQLDPGVTLDVGGDEVGDVSQYEAILLLFPFVGNREVKDCAPVNLQHLQCSGQQCAERLTSIGIAPGWEGFFPSFSGVATAQQCCKLFAMCKEEADPGRPPSCERRTDEKGVQFFSMSTGEAFAVTNNSWQALCSKSCREMGQCDWGQGRCSMTCRCSWWC